MPDPTTLADALREWAACSPTECERTVGPQGTLGYRLLHGPGAAYTFVNATPPTADELMLEAYALRCIEQAGWDWEAGRTRLGHLDEHYVNVFPSNTPFGSIAEPQTFTAASLALAAVRAATYVAKNANPDA